MAFATPSTGCATLVDLLGNSVQGSVEGFVTLQDAVIKAADKQPGDSWRYGMIPKDRTGGIAVRDPPTEDIPDQPQTQSFSEETAKNPHPPSIQFPERTASLKGCNIVALSPQCNAGPFDEVTRTFSDS